MEFHPLANLFPLLEGAAFDALRDDIKANGVRARLTKLDGKLLDGRNRWRAAEAGGVAIPTNMIRQFDSATQGDPLTWVLSMNLHRRHLDESQRAMVMARLAKLPQGSHPPIGGSSPTQGEAANLLNVSVRSGQRARFVLDNGTPDLIAAVDQGHIAVSEAAKAATLPDDEQFAVAAEAGKGKVNGLLRKMSRAKDEARILSLVPVPGKYSTLVIDPPWDYDFAFVERAAPDYATMTLDALHSLDVGQWAGDDCALYLWTTNAFMMHAGELMAHWGFGLKTIITWVKPHIGLGRYFRNTTEHILFGTRGNVAGIRRADIPTHFEAPTTGHSKKPEKFYDIVRAASYPEYGEIFQRDERPDFKNLYQPTASDAA
jgi:N6-adenosine-specific RNA methylase IME4